MNNKGESSFPQIGMIIMIAVAAIVGLTFLQSSAQNVGAMTNTVNVANQSFADFDATLGITPSGQAVSSVVIINATGGEIVPSTNYTTTNYIVSNGVLISNIKPTADSAYKDTAVNVSYTYEPYGYAKENGTRVIASLVVLFFALGIAVAVLSPTLRSDILNKIGI